MSDPTEPPELVVGFDLDMTLVDPRPGVEATFAALSAELGIAIDGAIAASRLGPPLDDELAHWLPAERIPEAGDRYRAHFASVGVAGTAALPGARAAVDAVHELGGRAVVITAKAAHLAHATLDRVGLAVDDVVGWTWAEAKGEALGERGGSVYVGDHTGDMVAARVAGAIAVAVTTGADAEADLRAAGADVVLRDLMQFPQWLTSYVLDRRLAALAEHLQRLDRVMVAFSGGADSAFLLAAAVRVLGADNVVAATAISPSLPADERRDAEAFAAGLGVRHVTPRTDELARAGYRANAGDRCWFCKAELLDVLRPVAESMGFPHIATGTNADDALAGFRPGIRAAEERHAVTPLRDAALTKPQVREASRRWGLSTWDKPAAACLSSRIAFGVEVTAQRLSRVERAETALRLQLAEAGVSVRDLRVRDLGDRAVVEIDRDVVPAVAARPGLLAAVEGFDAVELDPRGFRSGSMNERLADAELWR